MNDKTYSIVMICNVYQPDLQGRDNPSIIRDEDNNEIVGITMDEARDMIKTLDDAVYYTSSNESGRPDYYIVHDSDATYYTSGRNGNGGNYSCPGCVELMRDEDIVGVKKDAIV